MNNKTLKDKSEIIKWLDNHFIFDYSLVACEGYGYVVDVKSDVNLKNKNLSFIPVKFNKVNGNFNCSENQLTTPCNCPEQVSNFFHCNDNMLTSLEFCPKIVGGYFFCSRNKLTNLEFCPQSVGDYFYCIGNEQLGEIQEIVDFKEIYQIHKNHLQTIESYDKLNSTLKIQSAHNKIKI